MTEYLSVIEFANGGIMIMSSEEEAIAAIECLAEARMSFTLRGVTDAELARMAEALVTV